MKVATAEEMRRIDERAQKEFSFPGDELMAAAGAAVARRALEHFAPARVCVVCGKGNNGGDGFVAARELYAAGVAVDVICLFPPDALRGSAARAYMRLAADVPVAGPERLPASLASCDLVLDAILGIGARGPAAGPVAEAIELINGSKRPVLAVDVPSGLVEGPPPAGAGPIAVRASMTVTIGLPKLALLAMPGAQLCGRLVVEPIQFPAELLEDGALLHHWARPEELARWLPPRPPDSNKGDFGRVGIVAGSAPFAGAAILMARAALRGGCGLVYVFTTPGLNPVFKTTLPEAVTVLVPSRSPDWLDDTSAEAIIEKSRSLDVLAVGPGLGTSPPQRALVGRLLSELSSTPLVLDADALTNLVLPDEEGRSLLEGVLSKHPDAILTPHPGEMARLLGGETRAGDIQRDRVATARTFAIRYGVTLLLKGASTVIARANGEVFISPGATAALAKGGTGDVLAGLLAGLVAQGMEPWKAAVLGAHVHLEAGRRCARRIGARGVLAGEVADELPLAMEELERGAPEAPRFTDDSAGF